MSLYRAASRIIETDELKPAAKRKLADEHGPLRHLFMCVPPDNTAECRACPKGRFGNAEASLLRTGLSLPTLCPKWAPLWSGASRKRYEM